MSSHEQPTTVGDFLPILMKKSSLYISRLSRATFENICRCDKILDRDINANYFTTEWYIDLFKIVLVVVKILKESVIIAPIW